MYSLRITDFGFLIELRDVVSGIEAAQCFRRVRRTLAVHEGAFSVIVDARNLVPPEPATVAIMGKIDKLIQAAGMERMAVVFCSPIIKGQSLQEAFTVGTVLSRRHIDAFRVENWEQVARDWVIHGIEPPDHLICLKPKAHKAHKVRS